MVYFLAFSRLISLKKVKQKMKIEDCGMKLKLLELRNEVGGRKREKNPSLGLCTAPPLFCVKTVTLR